MEKQNLPQPKNQKGEVVYYQDDEIDLYEVYLILKKRWKILAFTVFISVFIGITYSLLATPLYKYTLRIKIPVGYTSDRVYNPIDYTEISALLKNLKMKNTRIEVSIPAEFRRTRQNYLKTIDIKITSSDKSTFQSIGEKLIEYLENHPYIKEKLEEQKKHIKELIKIAKETEDRLQNKDRILLKEKVLNLQNRLNELNFEVVSKGEIPKEPYKPKKGLIISIAFLSGLFLGGFIVFFLEWLENVKKRTRTV